jgi:hypothetical protein
MSIRKNFRTADQKSNKIHHLKTDRRAEATRTQFKNPDRKQAYLLNTVAFFYKTLVLSVPLCVCVACLHMCVWFHLFILKLF